MKKRIFSLFTSLIMVISMVAVLPAMTAGAEISGDYEYIILSDETVGITRHKGKTYYFTVKAYRTVGGKTYNGKYTTKRVTL